MIYQAVIFDLDGTLRGSEPRFMDALHDCLLELDIEIEPFQWRLTERWVHRYWAQSPELIMDVDTYGDGGIWSRFLARLMEHAGHPPQDKDIEAFGRHVREFYQPDSELMPGALETLQALGETGITLGVLSNREKPFIDELVALNIDPYFDFTLAAGEIGIWKPRREIFDEGLIRAGRLCAQDVIYIGDNYYADIVGAQNAGWDAILLNDRGVFTDMPCQQVTELQEILEMLDGRLA
ncbi:MAG: HAD family hydrolase [Chloroflexi bacterium]|nr:HAD family hydrolase [Chloroflexota bacterium]